MKNQSFRQRKINFFIFVATLLVLICFACTPSYAIKLYLAACTEGSNCMDSIDGNLLADGDGCFVQGSSNVCIYQLNASSGAAETSESPCKSVVSPTSNAGTKRWILSNFGHDVKVPNTFGLRSSSTTSGNYFAFKAYDTDASAWVDVVRILNGNVPEFQFQPGSILSGLGPLSIRNGNVSGGYIDFYEKTENGTDYLRIAAHDDAGATATHTFTLSSSIGNAEDFTITLGQNNDTVTFGSTTGVTNLVMQTGGIILGDSTPDTAGETGYANGVLRYYDGTASRGVAGISTFSIAIPSVTTSSSYLFTKLPYNTILSRIDCVVTAATNAVINIQECSSTGSDCVNMATSNLTCGTTPAYTTTFSDSTADADDWLKIDIVSVSGTPGTLSAIVRYYIQ